MSDTTGPDRQCHRAGRWNGHVSDGLPGVSLFAGTLTCETIRAIRFNGRTSSDAPLGRSTMLASNIFRLTAAIMRRRVATIPQHGLADGGVEAIMELEALGVAMWRQELEFGRSKALPNCTKSDSSRISYAEGIWCFSSYSKHIPSLLTPYPE